MTVGVAGRNPNAPKIVSAGVNTKTSAIRRPIETVHEVDQVKDHSPPTVNNRRWARSAGSQQRENNKSHAERPGKSAAATPFGRTLCAAPTAAMTIGGKECQQRRLRRSRRCGQRESAGGSDHRGLAASARCAKSAHSAWRARSLQPRRMATMIATLIAGANAKAAMAAEASKPTAPWPMRSLTIKVVAENFKFSSPTQRRSIRDCREMSGGRRRN